MISMTPGHAAGIALGLEMFAHKFQETLPDRGRCFALEQHLQFALPPFLPEKPPVDNWQTSPGMQRSPSLGDLQAAGAEDEHFD